MTVYQANIAVRVDEKSTTEVNNLQAKLKSIQDSVKALKNATVSVQNKVAKVTSGSDRVAAKVKKDSKKATVDETKVAEQKQKAEAKRLRLLQKYEAAQRASNSTARRARQISLDAITDLELRKEATEELLKVEQALNRNKKNIPNQFDVKNGKPGEGTTAAVRRNTDIAKQGIAEINELLKTQTALHKQNVRAAEEAAKANWPEGARARTKPYDIRYMGPKPPKVINKRMATEDIDAKAKASEQRAKFERQIRLLEAEGLDMTRQRQKLGEFTNAQIQRRYGSLRQITRELKGQLAARKNALDVQRKHQGVERKVQQIENGAEKALMDLNAAEQRYDQQTHINKLNQISKEHAIRMAGIKAENDARNRQLKADVQEWDEKFNTSQREKANDKKVAGIENKARTEIQRLEEAERAADEKNHKNKINQIKKEEAIELEAIKNTAKTEKLLDDLAGQEWKENLDNRVRAKAERTKGFNTDASVSRASKRVKTLRGQINKFEQDGVDLSKERKILDEAEIALGEKELAQAKAKIALADDLLEKERQIAALKKGSTSTSVGSTGTSTNASAKPTLTPQQIAKDRLQELAFNKRIRDNFLAGQQAYKEPIGPQPMSMRTPEQIKQLFPGLAIQPLKEDAQRAAKVAAKAFADKYQAELKANSQWTGVNKWFTEDQARNMYAGKTVGPEMWKKQSKFDEEITNSIKLLKSFEAQGDATWKKYRVDLNSTADAYKKVNQAVQQRKDGQRDAAEQTLKDLKEEIDSLKQVRKTRMKIRNDARRDRIKNQREARITNSPVQQRKQKVGRFREGLGESLMLGVGFPMMFGAGAGSILGSGVGSFIGKSGFGGQIIGGAIGMMVDEFIAATTRAGKALMTLTDSVAYMSEMAIFSSKSVEKAVKQVEAAGLTYKANELAAKDFRETFGNLNYKNLIEAGKAADELNREMGKLFTYMQAGAAPAVASFMKTLTSMVKRFTLSQRFENVEKRIVKGGNKEQLAEFTTKFKDIKWDANYERNLDRLVRYYESTLEPIEVKVKTDFEQLEEDLEKLQFRLGNQNLALSAINTVERLESKLSGEEGAKKVNRLIERRNEIIEDASEKMQEMRLQQERRVQDMALANIAKQNELYRIQGDIRLQQLRNENQRFVNEFTTNEVSQAAEAIAEYTEQKLSIENEINNNALTTELEVRKSQLQAQRVRQDSEAKIAKLKRDTAKDLKKIDADIDKAQKKRNKQKLELEIKIAGIQLDVLEKQARMAKINAEMTGDKDLIDEAKEVINLITEQQKAFKQLSVNKGATSTAAGAATSGVQLDESNIDWSLDTSAIDSAAESFQGLLVSIQSAQKQLQTAIDEGNYDALVNKLDSIFKTPFQTAVSKNIQEIFAILDNPGASSTSSSLAVNISRISAELDKLIERAEDKGLDDIVKRLEDYQQYSPLSVKLAASTEFLQQKAASYRDELLRLRGEQEGLRNVTGLLTEEQKLLNELKANGIQINADYRDGVVALAEELQRERIETAALRKEYELNNRIKNAGRGLNAGFIGEAAEVYGNAIDQGIDESRARGLAELANQATIVEAKFQAIETAINGTADAIGTLLTRGVSEMINGTKRAEEVFAEFLNTIANALLDAAATMIATYIAIGIARAFAMGASPAPQKGPDVNEIQKYTDTSGDLTGWLRHSGGRTLPDGSYIVGERGPEIFTPDSPGTIKSNRAFDAARDSMSMEADARMSNVSEQRESNFYEAMQSPEGREMNVRYDATIINEVEYVTADQFQRGMKDTATRARAETLKDLRNYPSKRTAVGMR